MKRKILLAVAAIGTSVAMLPLLAAFEAHVINVTATIENALDVPIERDGLAFGTTFPQESLHQPFSLSLSQSFSGQNRVNLVDYTIRQKPKCQVLGLVDGPTTYVQVIEDAAGNFACPNGSFMLPLLCPYLSKHETTTDGNTENDSTGINSFHGLPGPWTLATTLATAVNGELNKTIGDISDTWDIDLHVPCFAGQCAQDWTKFVYQANPKAHPADYIQPAANEHKLFGCDLWLEVTGICGGQNSDQTLVSDTSDKLDDNSNAVALSFIHSAWTASIPGATWIWSTNPVANPGQNETKAFHKDFNVSGAVASAILNIAADNTYKVYMNNVLTTCASIDENNFQLATQDTCDLTAYIQPGANTLKVEVTNIGIPGSTPAINPAGLLYKFLVTAAACAQ